MDEADDVMPAPLPASRRGPLPPIQSKRRMSASWTENLEPSPDLKSPESVKSTESRASTSSRSFFPRSLSEVRPHPSDEVFSPTKPSPTVDLPKEHHKDEHSEKKHTRRDSIKDHLLKFKIKAGKVFEDVHDRLVEDHSSVAVAPLSHHDQINVGSRLSVQSPATPSQDIPSVADMDDGLSMDGRGVSPSLSQSSKRTNTSAELKASMRSKLRKQAEQTVERKRGSVQLARRLQRRLTIHPEEGPTEGELESVDEQIEHSLKVGARFLKEQASLYPPDGVQYAFFVEDYEEEHHQSSAGAHLLDYRRAEMAINDDANIVYYDARPVDVETNNGATNSSRMTQRLSENFFTEGKLRHIDDSLFVKPSKVTQSEDVSYNYVKAEPWESFLDEIRGSEYVQLDLFLGAVLFEDHPLSGAEDKLHVRLCSLYDQQCQRINEMTDALMDAENMPTSENSSVLRQHADLLYRDVRRAAIGLTKVYADLEDCRNQQGYATSPLKYTMDQEDESGSLLGKLTMDSPVTPLGALPPAVRTRIETLKKTTVQVILHFNDMFLCKSKAVPLEGLQLKFDRIYNLEIVSEPKTITATIIEKIGTSKKNTIAKVNIPLPDDNEATAHSPVRIPFESTDAAVNGFVIARASWSTEARTRRRESVAQPPPVNNDVPFAIIPPGVRLVSDEEFDSNPRWIAIAKRSRKRSANGRIPIDGSDIDIVSGALGEERRLKTTFRTAVDSIRAVGIAHAIILRIKLLERDEDAAELTYSEVVREEPLPGLFGALGSLCGPADLSRKLKPMRRAPIRQQNFSPSSLNLVVNVQSAVNLPTRNDGQLQPVVEVAFQNARRFTPSVSGRNPNWQQGLSLPVQGANDPKSIIDCIKLSIYDQIVNSLDKDDRLVNTVHEQLLRRLIGWVEIPFASVYARGKVDGWLRVQRPLFFTGYSMPDKASYVKVLIAFDPPQIPPRIAPPRRVDSVESEKILSQSHSWSKACGLMHDDRRYTALVTDINGKAVLACRYLGPVHPPSSVPHPGTDPRQTLEAAARLVSMVPFVTDAALFPGSTDLWTSAEKFLSLGCGDEEEHAVLLCCWLLSLQIPSCLVLGSALPEGSKAAYVFVNLPDGIYLVNPCDGSVYASTDAMCPMTSVGTVITPRNIYGNIQPSSHPSQLQFALNRTSDWRPLFDKDLEDVQSIQSPIIPYAQVSEDALVELKSSIEREIKLRFDEARQYGIPQWNLMASRVLREILQDDQHSVDDRLSRLRESYTVTVCAMTIPYRNIQDCVAAVLRCGLHTVTAPSPQFALAVHLQPAFGHVMSCSIAVALLMLKI